MELHKHGNSSLEVTPIGLGMAALGRPGYINLGHAEDLAQNYEIEEMRRRSFDVLDLAYQEGIRYFDAARSYGRAESFLGSWLESRSLGDEVTVGSKWGYTYTANWQVKAEKHEVKEHSLEVLQRQWQETRQNLGDYLNLYQIHSATLKSGVLENREVLEELHRLKTEYGIAIGFSASGENQPQIIRKALEVEFDGALLFESVQATWNILEPSAGEALKEAGDAGLGVIVKEALANGRLTDKNQNPQFAEKREKLKRFADMFGVSIDALAIGAARSQPWSSVILSGAARTDHLKSNMAAKELRLDPTTLKELEELKEHTEQYWAARDALEWN